MAEVLSKISSNLSVVAACAMLGLASMFGGIWLSDAQLITAESVPGAIVTMRICTLIIYVSMFALCYRFSKRPGADVRLLLGSTSLLGMLCFILGAALMFYVVPALPAESNLRMLVAVLAVYCIKIIGAPLSVGLVCVFARLERVPVMRACIVGMFGAFALYSFFSLPSITAPFGKEGIVLISTLLLAVALVCGMLGLGGTPVLSQRRATVQKPVPVALSVPGVVKRPWRKVITPGVVLELIFSAMMLGFLRNGITGVDPHADPVSLGALLVLLVVGACWKSLSTEHIFYFGLICAAVGVLLEAQLDFLIAGSSDFLFGLGVACFEVVMWSLVVWVTRNSDLTLLAASGSRLVAVVGHLLGTLLVAVAVFMTPVGDDALRTGELVMILIYFVLLIVLLKFPGLQAPFASPSDASEYEADSAFEAEGEEAEEVEEEKLPPVPFVQMPEPEPEPGLQSIDSYIDTIAETYHLTAREHEVLELIAHGRNMPYMEDVLFISRNTLKMHIRHIYTKLDVHSKQEIIDMVESLALS